MMQCSYQCTVFTKVAAPDDKKVKSALFDIRRGVVQGDITSPLYFILVLESIMRKYDERLDKGVTLGDTIVHTLGYADDSARVDLGDEAGVEVASDRVTKIEVGSKEDADMCLSIKKTKAIHVRTQDAVSATTSERLRTCVSSCAPTNTAASSSTPKGTC